MRVFVLPLIGVLAVLCAERVRAQPPLLPKDGKVTVVLTVRPTAVQQPLSRNYLLPEYKDSIPGNQVQMFQRCFMERDAFFGRDESAKRDKWNGMPLAELPAEEVKDYGGGVLGRDAVDASRMLSVDWQLWSFLQRDGYQTLLPDVQKMRVLATALKTRVRGQIRNGDHAGAIVTLRTLFALARTFEAHPSLIGQLVGLAIAHIGLDAAEELVQLPGCPNLFWSFTDLPTPFISLRMGAQAERVMIGAQFGAVMAGPVSEADLDRTLTTIDEIVQMINGPEKEPKPDRVRPRYTAWAADAKRVEAARARLVESGTRPEAVKGMSALQAVIADDLRELVVQHDEQLKWLRLPFWEIGPLEEAEKAMRKEKADHELPFGLFPLVFKVKESQVRVDQRVAALRLVEAIRLHTHQNGGKVPTSLDEIKLPLPLDPVTGKPFRYAGKDGVATFSGGNPTRGSELTNRVYEVHVQK